MQVTLDFNKITDWSSFHSACQEAMGFPDFYGRNMNAWIDCMSSIDAPDEGMSKVTVTPGDSLDIILLGTEAGYKHCPEVMRELLECAAFVNQRFIEANSATRIKLVAA